MYFYQISFIIITNAQNIN